MRYRHKYPDLPFIIIMKILQNPNGERSLVQKCHSPTNLKETPKPDLMSSGNSGSRHSDSTQDGRKSTAPNDLLCNIPLENVESDSLGVSLEGCDSSNMGEEYKERDAQVEGKTTSEQTGIKTMNKLGEGEREVVSTPIKRIDMGGRIMQSSPVTTLLAVEVTEHS